MSARFRWTTVVRAIELLAKRCSQAQLILIIEEFGFGPEMDRLPPLERTCPKMGAAILSAIRRDPNRGDSEGELASESLVRRAARFLGDPQNAAPWGVFQESPLEATLRNSLATDGWEVRGGELAPLMSVPIAEVASRLRAALQKRGYSDAENRLRQAEVGLDEGHWESANADVRAFLAAVFTAIAKDWPGSERLALEEGESRKFLERSGFFKPDPRNPNKSLEAEMVRTLFGLLGSEGSHAGGSDQRTAIYRYGMAALTADFFVGREAS